MRGNGDTATYAKDGTDACNSDGLFLIALLFSRFFNVQVESVSFCTESRIKENST